jgi:hypothetical protein
MSSTSDSRSAPGHGQQQICSLPASSGAGVPPATVRAASATSAPRPGTGSSLTAERPRRGGQGPSLPGYAYLYGGYDYQDRAAPGQEPWSRLRGFGPAFFTKFLYFSMPGMLILDNRLANAVRRLSQLPGLVTEEGRSLTWTPYRYSVYLHWMTQTARTVEVAQDLLELTLFQPPGSLAEENGAAN